ncbi:uncharacterized protein TNCV_3999151 [Trichonephila clavipes]|nr:uncharacterized protein TNCV_3999151 [Trichonephila clavipes]
MDEQLKALLEGINALKSGQEETKQEMQKGQQETQKGLEDMQKSQEETENELKERMENMQRSQEETKERMEKSQEDLRNTLEKKIDSVEEKIALKVEEKLVVVEEKWKRNFRKCDERKQVCPCFFRTCAFFCIASDTSSPVSVKLSTYEGKNNWEVYKTQFSIISEANGWTEGVKACQLAASLRGEAAEILQSLPDTERLNLNSLYNVLDLRFGQKYSKDYARLQMKTRLQKTGESLQEYASEVERLANLAFFDHPATVRETISLQYFVDGLKDGEIQKAVRMADVQDLKSALLYALKVEAANEASYRDSHSVRGARVTTDAPCESTWRKKIEKLRKEIQNLMAQRTGHVRSNFPRVNQEDPCRTSVTESKKVCSNRKVSDENGDVRSKRLCSESSKNLSNSLRDEKKFGVIDPVVRQVTTPSTSALDPWSDESVRKDQLADPEIKPIMEFKVSSDEKPRHRPFSSYNEALLGSLELSPSEKWCFISKMGV